jgi:hypothetical protein
VILDQHGVPIKKERVDFDPCAQQWYSPNGQPFSRLSVIIFWIVVIAIMLVIVVAGVVYESPNR